MFRIRRAFPCVSVTTSLAFAGWLVLSSVTPMAQVDAGVTPFASDPHEPANGVIRIPATPAERAAVFSLLERARQNSDMHMPGTLPFRLDALFAAGGNVSYVGPGELTEIWLSGQSWRWTASLGGYDQVQIGSHGTTLSDKYATAPLRVHMLRNAVFWPVRTNPASAIRVASIQWNGRPATRILLSRVPGADAAIQSRLWEEIEYCVDNASGLLQVYSIAPGGYAVYGYGKNLRMSGRFVPDQITFYD